MKVTKRFGSRRLTFHVHTPLPINLPLPRPAEPGLAVTERPFTSFGVTHHRDKYIERSP